MNYSIFDNSGNLMGSYSDEETAQAALREMADADPNAANEIALFAFDEEGAITNGPVHAAPPAQPAGAFQELHEFDLWGRQAVGGSATQKLDRVLPDLALSNG
jgi:hypothetical protein